MQESSERAAVVETPNCCRGLEKLILQNHRGNSTQIWIFKTSRFLIIVLVIIAILPPLYFHFRLRRFQQVNIYGGQVISWKDEHGEEFLFFSREALCCCQGGRRGLYRPHREEQPHTEQLEELVPPLEEAEEPPREEQPRPGEHAASRPAAHAAGPWSCRVILVVGIVLCWLCSVMSYLNTNCVKNLGAHNIWAIPFATGSPLIVYIPRFIKNKWVIDTTDLNWRTGLMLYRVLMSSITAAGSLILAPHLDGIPGLLASGFSLALVILCGFVYWEDTDCGFTITDMMTAIFLDRTFKEIHFNIPPLLGISFVCYLIREGGMLIVKDIYLPKENGDMREFLVHMKDGHQNLQNALRVRGLDPESIPELTGMQDTILIFESRLPQASKEEPVSVNL